MPSIARSRLAAASTGVYIVFAGGMLTLLPFDSVDAVDIFNAATGMWTSGPPMLSVRTDFAAAALGSLVYVFGGRTSFVVNDTSATGAVDVFDTVTGNWTTNIAARMQAPVWLLAAASTSGVAMYAGGVYVL